MDAWLVWVLIACGLAAAEMVTLQFFAVFFAAGALVAALAAALGAGTLLGLAVFLVVSTASLATLRPLVRRTQAGPPPPTNAAALIGRDALVLERIEADAGTGQVRLGGEVWTARAQAPGRTIEAGAHVRVVAIQGATALVTEEAAASGEEARP